MNFQPFVLDRLSVRLWALFFLSLLAILASASLLPEDAAFPSARPLGFVSIPIFSSGTLSTMRECHIDFPRL